MNKSGVKKKAAAKVAKGAPVESPKRKGARRKGPGWKAFAVLVGLVTVSFAGLAAYKQDWKQTHDLSVIGNGTPTVVQVHDPSCPQCRELKENAQIAMRRVSGDIQYRIADLNTAKGRALAGQHDAGKVTLLTFDAEGQFLDKYTGVMSVETLERLLSPIAGPPKT